MARSFEKDFKTFDEQLSILESRNLPAKDRSRCLAALRDYGYYRLSAYWYPFRIRSDDHIESVDIPEESVFPGMFLDDIIDVYELDSRLRQILAKALEDIELSLRVAIAYHMGQYERFAFENIALFADACSAPSHWDPGISQFEAFRRMLARRQAESKEDFIHHFEQRYDGRLPVWASIETWDFGLINSCFQILRPEDRVGISASLGVAGSTKLGSWLGPFRVLRNMCAHHSRLNRRGFTDKPSFPKRDPRFEHLTYLTEQQSRRIYPILVAMAVLLNHTGRRQTFVRSVLDFSKSVDDHTAANMLDYGFPQGWRSQEIWLLPEARVRGLKSTHSRRNLLTTLSHRISKGRSEPRQPT